MRIRYLGTSLLIALLLWVGNVPASGQGPAITPRKPVLIVSGTATGFTQPGVLLIEELVIHNDGLVTLQTAADTPGCRALARFATPVAVEQLRKDLRAAGGMFQADYSTGQTADLPYTTVTLFLGINGSRLDLTNSFTYERLSTLPPRLTAIRARIQTFVETTFPEFKQNGCSFPF
jgi:hypothetical protein